MTAASIPVARQTRPLKMLDRCGDLRNYWYAVALSKEVKKRPVARTVMETLLVVWRTRDGKAQVMRDRCPHRNALLSEGRVEHDRLTCPYHGWQFSTDGQCVNVPAEGTQSPLPSRRVTQFPVIERDGLIWAWLGDNEPLPDRLPMAMPFYRHSGWGCYYMKTRFHNNVTNLVENFMDVPHTVWVHPGWFRDKSYKRADAKVTRNSTSVIVRYNAEDHIGISQRLLNPRGLQMVHHDRFYMPNNTSCDYIFGNHETGFVITSTCTPIGPFETDVYTLISYRLHPLLSFLKIILPWYTRKVIAQDVRIMANQGRSLQDSPAEFKSTPVDAIHLYIESLRSAAECNSSPPPDAHRTVEFWI